MRLVQFGILSFTATLVLSAAAPSASFATSMKETVTPGCSSVGHGSMSDCVRAIQLGRTPDHAQVSPGKSFNLKLWLNPSLAQTNVTVEIQVRSLASGSRDGPWQTRSVYTGEGSHFGNPLDWRTVSIRAPKQEGVYEAQTRLSWGSTTDSALDAYTPNASSADTAVSRPTYILVQEVCTNSQDDLTNIEYFNEILFSEEITLQVTDLGTSFSIVITCPEPLSPTLPPPDFDLSLITSDNDASTTCSSEQQPIIINKAQLVANQVAYCEGDVCNFIAIFSNSSTLTVYSQTILQVVLTSGNQNIIPNLEPATLPICEDNPYISDTPVSAKPTDKLNGDRFN
jgi:hypothetical protein